MRDRATLDFIRDRVLSDIAAQPSVRPYLGPVAEVDACPTRDGIGRPRRETCAAGHPIVGEGQGRRCQECRRARERLRYQQRKAAP